MEVNYYGSGLSIDHIEGVIKEIYNTSIVRYDPVYAAMFGLIWDELASFWRFCGRCRIPMQIDRIGFGASYDSISDIGIHGKGSNFRSTATMECPRCRAAKRREKPLSYFTVYADPEITEAEMLGSDLFPVINLIWAIKELWASNELQPEKEERELFERRTLRAFKVEAQMKGVPAQEAIKYGSKLLGIGSGNDKFVR